jgi:antitoxin (DNA-binding transcriptional repressor) of toxin-antitoxin stability system
MSLLRERQTMYFVTLAEVQARLPELLAQLIPGDELIITKDEKPIAKLSALPQADAQPRFGSAKGKLIIVEDDDSHLEDFKEYM